MLPSTEISADAADSVSARVDERYSVVTWVEKLNRHFSTRNFMIAMADGSVAGYARPAWEISADAADSVSASLTCAFSPKYDSRMKLISSRFMQWES